MQPSNDKAMPFVGRTFIYQSDMQSNITIKLHFRKYLKIIYHLNTGEGDGDGIFDKDFRPGVITKKVGTIARF